MIHQVDMSDLQQACPEGKKKGDNNLLVWDLIGLNITSCSSTSYQLWFDIHCMSVDSGRILMHLYSLLIPLATNIFNNPSWHYTNFLDDTLHFESLSNINAGIVQCTVSVLQRQTQVSNILFVCQISKTI